MEAVEELEHFIQINNRSHENTLELLNYQIGLPVHDLNLVEEEFEVREYYKKLTGDPEGYYKKYNDEKFHYEQLKYSLLHKVKETQYFFKTGLENRKLIVFSSDCISMLHYLKRRSKAVLNCYMRSSDIRSLLPMDLLHLCKILNEINKTYCHFGELKTAQLNVSIGSAHYYLEGGRE